MKDFKYIWLVGLIVTILIVVVPIISVVSPKTEATPDPWAKVPVRPPHVDHTALLTGPYETGSDVTRAAARPNTARTANCSPNWPPAAAASKAASLTRQPASLSPGIGPNRASLK